jgi:PAS domain S-box-containing protein
MRIVLAEDDRVYQLLLHTTLLKWGYEPVVVTDGEEAWKELNSSSGPQLAVLDWMMPRADGVEVCRRVRSGNLPHYVYIVLVTSKNEPSDLMDGFEAGADDYLQKPVDLQELKLRLRAATRVLAAEERHRLIAEISSDGIVTIDRENAIGFANSAAGSIFGYPASEMVGKAFSELAPDFDSNLDRTSREVAMDGRECQRAGPKVLTWAPVELAARHVSGRDLALEISFGESVNSSKERVVAAMIRDVTDRKSRDVQRAHAQKMESIGQLAAGVAHEINTPIQYIGDNLRFIEGSFRGLGQMLESHQSALRDHKMAPGCNEHLTKIEMIADDIDMEFLQKETPFAISQAMEGVDRVAEIVRAMKEFAHPGLETAPVDLNHLIETTALVSRNRWKYIADLKTSFDACLPAVTCRAGELGQVFLNLMVNGADAIADAIKDRPGERGMLCVTTRRDGEFAEVRVRDTGTGIPPEARSKIFDPFFTTKAVGKGTGQGLALAHSIVAKRHGGTISFKTEMGAGTTMIVRLPIAGPHGDTQPDDEGLAWTAEGRQQSSTLLRLNNEQR